jgi:hypothetical protein
MEKGPPRTAGDTQGKGRTMRSNRHDKGGMILFAVMATLGGLTLLAGTVFTIIATDLGISDNYKTGSEAFFQADGGAAYVRDRLSQALVAGTLVLDGTDRPVDIRAPSGYTFEPVTNLHCLGNTNSYSFQITGRTRNARSTIEVAIRRKPLLAFGVFGNELIDGKATGKVMSYYSHMVANPTPADSTGDVEIGSNEDVTTYSATFIDGDLVLGADSVGVQGVWNAPGQNQVITGEAGLPVDRVDPDPLGAIGGDLATEFTLAATSNNNASASPPIPANGRIQQGMGETQILTAGNYYVSDITLGNGATLVVDASSGPVNIYLTGSADFKYGSIVNVSGAPVNFNLYSNSSQGIRLFNSSSFSGTIYAPLASVEVKNDGNFYGMVWGQVVDIKNSGEVYIDLNTVYRRMSNELKLLSWKDIRG